MSNFDNLREIRYADEIVFIFPTAYDFLDHPNWTTNLVKLGSVYIRGEDMENDIILYNLFRTYSAYVVWCFRFIFFVIPLLFFQNLLSLPFILTAIRITLEILNFTSSF